LSILLLITVDTEEDNWRPARRDITAENVRQLPVFADWLDHLGLRATYFTTYQIARRPWAADILRDVSADQRAEIGAHLHPWNTPPLTDAFGPRNTMMKNLSADLQLAKLRQLTAAMEAAFGGAPTAFRAGRFGLDGTGVSALISCGYRVDSSVTPYFSWEEPDGGPSFIGAPIDAYRVGEESGVMAPDSGGTLVEIPVTSGYAGASSRRWRALYRMLHAPAVRALPLASVACRLHIAKRTMLSPESETVRDMLALTRGALDGGARHLNLMFHSSTLQPGLTPWTATAADVVRLYAKMDQYLDGLTGMASVRAATISEARAALGFGDQGSESEEAIAAW
jgi:hypothetical protein